jgi:hypothetical protein
MQMFCTASINPSASSTSFYTYQVGLNPFTLCRIPIPISGTLVRVDIKVSVSGTLGSGETVQHFARINDSVDVGQVDLAYNATHVAGSAVASHAVVAGDFIAIKVIHPAWVTTPTTVRYYGSVVIEPVV